MPQCLDKNRLSAPRFSRERTKGSGLDQMRGRRRKGNYKTRGKRSREQRRWLEWEWKWGMMEGRNQGGENKRAEMADDDDAYAFPILSRPNRLRRLLLESAAPNVGDPRSWTRTGQTSLGGGPGPRSLRGQGPGSLYHG